jgi:SAM-dependent methyltransferase
MQTVRLGRKFDVVTCLGDSIHHLQNRRELKQFFANAKRHLKPDGVFLFDFNAFREVEEHESPYTGSVWTYRNPGEFICVEFVYDDIHRTSEWITTGFTKEGKRYRKFEEKHTLRGHPIEEVEETLDEVGFRARKFDNQSKSMRPRKNSNALYFRCIRED